MIIKCKKCGSSVDESRFWTVCPHNPLDQGVDAEFCKTHSKYDCFDCSDHLISR